MQIGARTLQWINGFYKRGSHFKKLRPVKFCRSFYQFEFHPLLLLILFRIEYSIQLTALVAGAIFVYQGASVIKNARHGIPGICQEVFYYPFRFIKDEANLFDREIVNVF